MSSLSEEEKERLRQEVLYIKLISGELARPKTKGLSQWLGLASNAAVLAVLGGIFTYWLGPTFQRRYEEHQRRKNIAQECVTEFLNYAVTPYEEFYATVPVSTRSQISEADFDTYQAKLTAIHISRFRAYNHVEGLLAALGDKANGRAAAESVHAYAIAVREFADSVDRWLNQLRCGRECPDVDAADLYDKMHTALHGLEALESQPTRQLIAAGGE